MTVKSGASSTFPPALAGRLQREGAFAPAPRERRSISEFNGGEKTAKPAGHVRRAWAAILRWVNKASADFWLSFFFWHAHRQPWFAAWTKPFFLFFVWRFSEHLYGGTMANAARILGESSTHAEREKLARRTIDNFYDFVRDVGLSLGQTPRQMLDRIISVENPEMYIDTRTTGPTAGKGAIILTAHMGSFEVGAAALMEREKGMHVLFRRDSLDLFEKIRSRLRKKIGAKEVSVDEGWTIWMRLRDALANDEVVLIQGDRVMPGQKGQAVSFFGGHVLLPTGPVRLALISGAPIIPVFSIRTPEGKIRLFIEKPIVVGDMPGGFSIDEAMKWSGCVLEKFVRRFPDQWLENRPVWIEDAGKPTLQPPMKLRIVRWKARVRGMLLGGNEPRLKSESRNPKSESSPNVQ